MTKFLITVFRYFSNSPSLFNHKNPLKRKAVRVVNNSEIKKMPIISTGKDRVPLSERYALVPREQNQFSAQNVKSVLRHPIIRYKKLEEADQQFTRILTMIKSERDREKCGKILLEGVRLINDAIDAGVQLEMVLFSQRETLSKLHVRQNEDLKMYKVLYKTLQVWSGLKTCPGIMGVCKKPTMKDLEVKTDSVIPVTVICHNITDSGKMGGIIRSAAAVGCKAVLVMKGCVDVWMHKVLRSGCGAQFRIPIISDIEWTHVLNYIPQDANFFLINSTKNSLVLDSNYEHTDYMDEEVLSERYTTLTEQNEKVLVDESYEDWHDLKKYKNVVLPGLRYTDVQFPKENMFLFVTDESLSPDLKVIKLCSELGGKQLNIPLENNVQSISSSLSLPIVLYEMRRQMIEEYVTY